jgi:hypothetical protein
MVAPTDFVYNDIRPNGFADAKAPLRIFSSKRGSV